VAKSNADRRDRGGATRRPKLPYVLSRALACALLSSLVFPGAAQAKGEVRAFLSGLKVSEPVKHANLTVFPLRGSPGLSLTLQTLDRAIADGSVKVEEKDGGEVNVVRVKNTAKRYVFGLAGEIITGAKQNRMLERDVLLPPGSGWLEVPVYCVEHGRWQGVSHEFSSKGQIAAGRVRGKAAATQSQSGVWDEVRQNHAELGITAAGERFDAVFEDDGMQKEVAGYRKALEERIPRLGSDVVGVAVAVGDRLVCMDAFGSNALFRRLWPRLLESYVVDAVSRRPKGMMTRADVAGFLKEAAGGAAVEQPSVGAGRLLRVEADEATGQALLYGTRVVHLDLFPESSGGGSPLRLDIRRSGSQRQTDDE